MVMITGGGVKSVESVFIKVVWLTLVLALCSLVTSSGASTKRHANATVLQLQSQQAEKITRCLSSRGLTNFTTPNSPQLYYKFLFSRINNGVFTRPTFLRPAAIILPHSSIQLTAAIQCSTLASLTIRLRSGGHSYEGLSSTAPSPFVIIDLRNLNRISIDLDSLTAWIESGVTLGQLYEVIAMSSPKLGFPAGFVSSIGTGGHLSGGGNGMLLRMYGLAADNILDATLVDATGRLLDRATMGEDVFWAIRGGGGGTFGAIYNWKIRLLPVPKKMTVFAVTRSGTATEVAELIHKWQFVAPNLDDEYYLMLFVSPVSASLLSASLYGFFAGPSLVAQAEFTQMFPELGLGKKDFLQVSWLEATQFLSRQLNIIGEDSEGSGFYKMKEDFVRETISLEGLKGAMEWLLKEPRGFFGCHPNGGIMSRIRSDSTPFPHRASSKFKVMYSVIWNKEEDGMSPKYLDWIKGFYEYMRPYVSNDQPIWRRLAEVNEIDLDFGEMDWENVNECDWWKVGRKWGERYFLGNYERLVRAKSLIDPKNVFRHPQSIPPLPQHCVSNLMQMPISNAANNSTAYMNMIS